MLAHYHEAEPLLQESYATLSRTLGFEDPRAQEILQPLIILYEAWRKPEQAVPYRALVKSVGE